MILDGSHGPPAFGRGPPAHIESGIFVAACRGLTASCCHTMPASHPDFAHDASSQPDFGWYQQRSADTWSRIEMNHAVVYPTLGLVNEAGEFAGKIKKIFRDKGGVISAEDRAALQSELGDVLWYLTQICTQLDLELAEVAQANIAKLRSRQRRGNIGGDGDDR